ncbi:MAG TPA: dTMP kinase [Tepidisphaeraceae bacterium]|nr:dTMP kinase [Tepidisphaeraceae bacterium]
MSDQQTSGRFIVLDGGEGCGKTTQIQLLRERLAKTGREVVVVRDPGTTRIGELIRSILLNPDHNEMGLRCEMLLYMAARAQMMAETIGPALDRGAIVLGDRFVSSTLSYQLGGDGLTADEIRTTARIALRDRMPQRTVVLDMPVERSIARVTRAKDRIEQRPIEYHQRVRSNFLDQVRNDPAGYRVVDADRDPQMVHHDVWNAIAGVV